MASYSGYEIVREISRSPMGFSASARRPGGRGEDFLVEVRLPDPIAAPGEERIGIDAFVRQARVQESIDSPSWVRVHAVGEADDEAFVVKDFYPRSVRWLIEGRARLDGDQLRQIAMGIIDGLVALRDQAGGRVHGELRASRVLIDDSGGPTRWRVLLSSPGEIVGKAAGSREARVADRRAVARLLIGLVEQRLVPTAPGSVGANERWKRVTGAQAEQWVSAINRLLDADQDPDAFTLEDTRALFERITVPKARSKSKLVIVGVLALALLGAGGYVSWRLTGGGKGPVVPSELTHEAWVSWLRGARLHDGLAALDEDAITEGAHGTEAAGWYMKLREELIEKAPDVKGTFSIWKPHNWLDAKAGPLPTLDQLCAEVSGFADPAEDRYWAELSDPKLSTNAKQAPAAAAMVIEWVGKLKAHLAGAPGMGADQNEFARLGKWLVEGNAAELLLRTGASGAPAWTGEGVVPEAQAVREYIALVADAARAGQLNKDIEALDLIIAGIVSGGEAGGDPILKHTDAIVRAFVGTADGETLGAALDRVDANLKAAEKELGRVRAVLDNEYRQVDPRSLKEALAGVEWQGAGLAPLERWREEAKCEDIKLLSQDENPIFPWRDGGAGIELWSRLPQQITQLEQFQTHPPDDELAAAIEEIKRLQAAIEKDISDGLDLPPTKAWREELGEIAERLKKNLKDASRTADREVSKRTIKYDELRERWTAKKTISQTAEINDTLAKLYDRLLKRPKPAEYEQLLWLKDTDDKAVELLRAIDEHFGVRLDFGPAGVRVETSALNGAFETIRTERLQDALDSVDIDSVAQATLPQGADPTLESVAAAVRDGLDSAVKLIEQLDGWQRPGTLTAELAELSAFEIGAAGVTAAQAQAINGAFRGAVAVVGVRVSRASGVSGTPGELLWNVRERVNNRPEFRLAAYEALGAASDWPRTKPDLEAEVAARDALVASIGEANAQGTLDGLLAEVASLSAGRWHAALAAAADEATFQNVLAIRDSFRGTDGLLTPADHRNMRLLALKESVAGVDRTDEEAGDQRVSEIVRDWLAEARQLGLFADETGWLAELEAALESQSQGNSGGQFKGEAFGPASAGQTGWTFAGSDAEFTYLEYRVGGQVVRLVRVPGEFDSDFSGDAPTQYIWYLQDDEVSFDLFQTVASATGRAAQWRRDSESRKLGPRVWRLEGQFSVAPTWIENISDFTKEVKAYAPSLADAESVNALKDRAKRPSGSMPMNQVSDQIMIECAQALGLRLPKRDVWRAAMYAEIPELEAGSASIPPDKVRSLGLNLRDRTWEVQAEYEKSSPSRPAMIIWRSGWFGQPPSGGDTVKPWSDIDDGYLFFAPTNRPRDGGVWRDLIGNVAEIVTGGDAPDQDLYVVGGSAMSPPPAGTADLEQQVPPNFRGQRILDGAADVGFRLALRVPKEAFRTTVAQRVDQRLRGAPFGWASGP